MRNPTSWRARCSPLVLLMACAAPSHASSAAAPPPAPADGARPAATAPAAGCPTHKLRFDRETACHNDGFLEFCVPSGDAALEGRIRSIAPSAAPAPEWHGRAHCDEARETHWALPTRDPAICTGARGEVTEAGWEAICRLAALPEIQAIVPTIWLR